MLREQVVPKCTTAQLCLGWVILQHGRHWIKALRQTWVKSEWIIIILLLEMCFVSVWMKENHFFFVRVAGNGRLHSLIFSFLFSRCSFAFSHNKILTALEYKDWMQRNRLRSFLCDIDFPFMRNLPAFPPVDLNCLQMIFHRFFQNNLLKCEIDFLSGFHRRTLSYLRNNSGVLLSSHSPTFGTYFPFRLL